MRRGAAAQIKGPDGKSLGRRKDGRRRIEPIEGALEAQDGAWCVFLPTTSPLPAGQGPGDDGPLGSRHGL